MPRKNNRRNRTGNKRNVIARITRNVMSPRITKLVQYPDVISSSAASTNLIFSSTSTTYLNLTNLLSQGDYTSIAADYQFAKIRSVKIAVNRLIAEQTVVSVYASGTLPMIYIGYIPAIFSSVVSNIKNLETALRVNPYNVKEQSREWKVPSVQALSELWGTTVAMDSTKWYSTQGATAIGGEMQLSLSSTNALTTTPLYAVTMIAEFEFACPY